MSSILGATSMGFEGAIVEVECSSNNGLPITLIVGLSSKAVNEAKERIKFAFTASGLVYPKKRILINLAPADIPKNDTSLDLALAIAIVYESARLSKLSIPELQPTLFMGELALDGSLRPIKGIIGKLLCAKRHGVKTAYVPRQNLAEASLVKGVKSVGASNLLEVFELISGSTTSESTNIKPVKYELKRTLTTEFQEIIGQAEGKRALAIAISGGHNLHFYGPPGAGKTALAKSCASLIPDLTDEEAMTVSHIHSLGSGKYSPSLNPPFRAPHHTSSRISIVGGGIRVKPGEISLAHNGILFLDELPEFSLQTIESLRQPLEDKQITLSRSNISTTYPANFILIATSNPCPCGYAGSSSSAHAESKNCTCSQSELDKYRKRLSGPIIDRIDLHLRVESSLHANLLTTRPQDSDDIKIIQQQIRQARNLQLRRNPNKSLNGNLSLKELKTHAQISPQASTLLQKLGENLGFTSRGIIKTYRVSRTIADLENSSTIKVQHVAEAAQYRPQTFE